MTVPPSEPDLLRVERHRRRALVLWDTLSSCIRVRKGVATVGHGPGASGATFSWPYGQVLAAALDLDRLDGTRERTVPLLAGLERYRRGNGYADAPGGHERYYDDNAWLGLDAVQAYAQWGDPSHVANARRTLAFVMEGAHPEGGVWWKERPKDSRNACSTLPAAALALRVRSHTEDASERERLLDFASLQVRWADEQLVGPDELVADNLNNAGMVEPRVWAYNQGSWVGALMLLADGLQDPLLRVRARAAASAGLHHFDGERLWTEPPAFVGIWYRNLLGLAAREIGSSHEPTPVADGAGGPDGSLVGAISITLDRYLDRVWNDARDESTGWCRGSGIGRYDDSPVLDTAALVQLYALAASPATWLSDVS